MFVIPMAGRSQRFTDAGYTVPKYMLEAHGKTLFNYSISSFKNYFLTHHFLFIILQNECNAEFVRREIDILGIVNFDIIEIEFPTRGQAETVAIGLNELPGKDLDNIYIFNIDTFRPGFLFPDAINFSTCDGYLEVFLGHGKNWSNVEHFEGSSNLVSHTAEKQEISNLCCTGLYYFRSSKLYFDAYNNLLSGSKDPELFIAPMYNYLINHGYDIRSNLILSSDVIFCGVPAEYDEFRSSLNKKFVHTFE